MVERRCKPGFAQEPSPEVGIVSEIGRDHLERNPPLEPSMSSQIDRAHSPAAEDGFDPVRAELVAGVHGQVRRR
jgi:hypothetical protein